MRKRIISDLLKSGESDRIERTISTNDTSKFSEAVCAFANNLANHDAPGYLFIGVDDNGILSGLKVTDKLLKNLGALRSEGNILPPPIIKVEKITYNEGDVAVVEVQPSFFPPVRYKGKVWVRIGPRKAVANEAEERILIEKRQANIHTFDAYPMHDSKIEDLDVDLFKYKYLHRAIAEDVLNSDKRSIDEQLASLRLFDLKKESATVAGILLFAKNPEYFLPGAYIQYVRFDGKDRAANIVREVKFSGNLITMLDNLDGFIKNSLIERKPVPVSVLREAQQFNYPSWALRELLMNAVMHRDYHSNTPIRLYQYDDRIEIMNAGGLYGNARPENFPNVNDYRNPIVAEAMKVLGYVNRFSRGVVRVNQELIDNENGEARFNFELMTAFEVTVKLSKNFTIQDTMQDVMQDTMQVDQFVKRLITCMENNEELLRKELQKRLMLKSTDNFRKTYLQPAIDLELIEMTIPDKPTSRHQRYRLTDKGQKILKKSKNK